VGAPGPKPERASDANAIVAVALGAIAWASLVAAFFFLEDAFLFLLLGLVFGAAALVIGLRARRDAAAVAGVAGAAGLAMVYGAAVASMLVAAVYATGVLVFLVFLFLLALLFTSPSFSWSSGGSTSSSCCCEDCGDCCSDCCDCGSCCDCGCGDCGGCVCGALLFAPAVARHAPVLAPIGLRERLARIWRDGLAHHPATPEFREDVLLLHGARLCIGCFVTYPVFLAGIVVLLVAPASPAWSAALLVGLAAASAQLVSSAGLARRRWTKIGVKTLLGAGLALYVWGVREAPWSAWARALALAFALALALASTIPRARRMRAARKTRATACACATDAGAREA
jgi:hypothetical protein